MRSKANMSKVVHGEVSQEMIDLAKGCDPHKCMYKLAVSMAINVPGGYIKVDSSGVSITRRTDFREKAFLPMNMIKNMLLFDEYKRQMEAFRKGKREEKPICPVKPHKFKLTFIKTTKVYRSSEERKEQINKARRKRKEEGRPDRKYYLHKRVAGLSAPMDIHKRLDAI